MGITRKYNLVKTHLIKQAKIVLRILKIKKRIQWKRILGQLELSQVLTFKCETSRQEYIMCINAHKTAKDMSIKIRTCTENGVLYVQRIG
jgi:hypothetical protein